MNLPCCFSGPHILCASRVVYRFHDTLTELVLDDRVILSQDFRVSPQALKQTKQASLTQVVIVR